MARRRKITRAEQRKRNRERVQEQASRPTPPLPAKISRNFRALGQQFGFGTNNRPRSPR